MEIKPISRLLFSLAKKFLGTINTCPSALIFDLFNASQFSRSQVQHYILVVQAQDNGHPSLSTTITVYCNVLDLNDNAPIFDPMSYSNEIYENIAVGKDVVTISATDIDSGKALFIPFWLSLSIVAVRNSRIDLEYKVAGAA